MAHFGRFLRRSLLTLTTLGVMAGAGYGAMQAIPLLLKPAEAEAAATATPAKARQAAAASGEIQMAQATGAAEKTTTTTSKYGGWTVMCSEGGEPPRKSCSANYRVINKNSNSNLLVWMLGFNREGKLLTELLTLTDVRIQPGVALTLDEGKPVKVDYVECTTKGCKARIDMTPNLLRALKAAKSAKIEMTRLDGQVIQFAMEIPGVDQALADLGV